MTVSPSLAKAGRWIEDAGYSLCYRGDWISRLWSTFWFRWYCPRPVIANHTARACIASGNCGCNNGPATSKTEAVK